MHLASNRSATRFELSRMLLNMRRTSKPAKTKVKWLKLQMSRPVVLCYGQTVLWPIHCYCHISKMPLIMQNFLNLVV